MGGVALVDHLEDDACVYALVFQHRLQLAPAGIEHRLGHPGLHEFRGRYIAHMDFAVPAHQLPAEFVQGVLASVGDPGVDRSGTGLLPGALGDGKLRLQIAVKPAVLQFCAIAAGGNVLEAEVDTDCSLPEQRLHLDLDDDIEVPAAARILAEAGRAEPVLAHTVAVPDLEVVPVVVDLPVLPARRSGVDRNPAEGATGTARLSPIQPDLLELPAPGDVLGSHALQGVAVQTEILAAAFGVGVHVVGGQKDSALANRALAQFVQVVPDQVYAAGHLAQQRSMLVSNANLQGLGLLHAGILPNENDGYAVRAILPRTKSTGYAALLDQCPQVAIDRLDLGCVEFRFCKGGVPIDSS